MGHLADVTARRAESPLLTRSALKDTNPIHLLQERAF